MANPAYYDFFRKILLQPDASESGTSATLEADTVTDTLTINGSPGVKFSPNESGDEFNIEVDYQLFVPIGSTNIRLQDANDNLQDVQLRAGTGVQVFRENANSIAISAYGVAESDTLHTVSNRGRITDQDLIMNGLTVGTVISAAGTDGMSAQDIRFIGDGTLNNPLQLQPTEREVTTDPYNETFTFSTAAGAGILGYQIGIDTGSTLIPNYEFTLEREDPNNPGTWIVLENEVKVSDTQPIFVANQYAEVHNGSVNFRYTVTASGFDPNGIEIQGDFTYEVYDVAASPVLETDSSSGNITVRDILPATASITIGSVAAPFDNIHSNTFTGDVTGNVTGDVTGDVTGNADTATALETDRAIAISGAVTGAGISFDGTSDITINTTFTNSNISQFTNNENYIDLTNISASGDISYDNTTGAITFNNSTGYITLTSLSASGDISYDNATGAITFNNATGYITGITSGDVTTALGFTPYNSTNPNSYISGITSGDVTTALGFTPYNSTNPNGYISSEVDTLNSVTGRGATTANAITVAGFTNNGNTTLGNVGTNVVTFNNATGTPSNATTPSGYMQVTINGATRYLPYYT